MTSQQLALQRSLFDVVAEYDHKVASVPQAISDFEAAGKAYQMASVVGSTYGRTSLNTGYASDSALLESLLKSAWKHIYDGLNINLIASARDKRLFEQGLEKPIAFTLENIRATFGQYLLDPRSNILRGLAEVFCDLDPAYKSHDKVRIGVKGLPKRIILTNVTGYGSWGRDRLQNVLNALAQFQNKPLVTFQEIDALLKNENALLKTGEIVNKSRYSEEVVQVIGRGVRLRRFDNGNGHLFFEPDTLRDINVALAEYYGDVLPDCSEEKPEQKQASTAVSKDLQYYPTPANVVERVIGRIYIKRGDKILEPSCGCGRILDALREAGADAFGIEYDASRANQSRAKGHSVMIANFLETAPNPIYDRVVMNPPFYGKHYAKHVEHALKFLKSDGTLTAILPSSARYDHGILKGQWEDLPVGSFAESGTNINTTILTI